MKKSTVMSILILSFLSLSVSAYESSSRDQALKDELYKVTIKGHKSLGYNTAKKILFGTLHLEKNDKGYFIRDLYCEKEFTSGIGPGGLPDQNQINCEHTWPQSKFTKSFPNDIQKSDLHHLYPTDSRANSTRGNFEFAEVVSNQNLKNCAASQSGPSEASGGKNFFEPPFSHKGNVARALFYFSVRYKMPIDADQEAFLRSWHTIDPVDSEELERNNSIAKLQGNRNPFIDNPGLVDQISNF